MKAYLSDDGLNVVVFFDGIEEPEWYTADEFVAMYGEDLLPECGKPTNISTVDYGDYWSAAIELVNAWSSYQDKRKLFANFLCEGTRREVAPIIGKYYKGDLNRLKCQVREFYAVVDEKITIFRYYCQVYKVAPVSLVWLKKKLPSDAYYKSLRGKCQRRMAAGKQPVSLAELVWKK